ncbi:twin-arginine translocase subunit TatC [Sedimentibacter hydroxybenzoicus DSM 7310]|uniref:Sec-independent protein translocase protein TatC n=1 Tax=Sedimentibacter hydroxybenzoicus DSM 7310 TaxID=1123245 RepID=A0A974BLA6_SEDHY|nr:twin-arginine translocase subunit TatC [Sedimentibacter hydroxybenzoicus]NYB74720.1 twin-arginine translocase subunit TatC [Sedimentibacter hydroxybenzoicus DSM 7310]
MMRKKQEKDDAKSLTLVEHLTELRKRLIYSSVVLIVSVFVSYNFSEVIVRYIIDIAPNINFVFIAPAELLLSYVKIAVISGFVVSAPFLILQIWIFVSPGLKKKEKRTIATSLFVGGIFFIAGVVFAFLVVLPIMLQFFMGFQIEEIEEMISFSSYLTFVINTLLSFGIIFELPIIMVILTRFRIISVSFIKKNRKYTILIIFIVAAILTPPEVITQILLAVPMILLFEVGVLFASLIERKEKKKKAELDDN